MMHRTQENKENIVVNHLDADVSKWFAIYTKYKCEKYVVDNLSKKGITAYVPLLSKTRQYTRKTKHLKVPLINCYVFVCITKRDYVRVLETEYVSGYIKQRKNLVSIPQEEIDILKRVVGEIENIHTGPIDYSIGQDVEIIGGNLTGLTGKLIDKHGKHSFVVQLQTIGLQLEMVVDKSLLSPLGKNLRA